MIYPFFCYARWPDHLWFRVCGYGLSFKRGAPTFSVRMGIRKSLPICGGWRMKALWV